MRDANDCKIFNSQHFNRSNGSIEGTYTLSAYMKTQDVVSENGGAFIGAYAWNNDGTEEYFHTDFQLGTSTTDVETVGPDILSHLPLPTKPIVFVLCWV